MKENAIKTLVFVSNYFNHHQKPLSEELNNILGSGYHFIETSVMSQERVALGYGEDNYPDYVVINDIYQKEQDKYQAIIDDADVVIFGSAPYSLIKNRLSKGKLTFIYSERLYKKGCKWYKLLINFVRFRKKYGRYKGAHLLCASAYTAADYSKTFTFRSKAYKWGYFPQVKEYESVESLIAQKKPLSILWVARLIRLKHPEHLLEVAKRLKQDGYDFELNIIGMGVLEDEIKNTISDFELGENVHMLGAMKPEEVREYMEKSEIFLFTSDRNEGWGAVLNESMNSACAVVASHAIGSVPFVIEEGKNGLIYKDGDIEDLYNKTKWLLDHEEERKSIAYNAYISMLEEWNAKNAANKLKVLAERIFNEEKSPFPFETGVCSKSMLLKDNWKK